MILLVVLGILVATLFFLGIIVNTSLYYDRFTRTADHVEKIFGQKGLTWQEKTITVYVRYIDSNSQKELNDLYGDN